MTQLLNDAKNYSQLYCCGPEIMMKKVLDQVVPSKAQFSLHRYFKCGLGICSACCVDGLRVCKDGPVFTGGMSAERVWGCECG